MYYAFLGDPNYSTYASYLLPVISDSGSPEPEPEPEVQPLYVYSNTPDASLNEYMLDASNILNCIISSSNQYSSYEIELLWGTFTDPTTLGSAGGGVIILNEDYSGNDIYYLNDTQTEIF